MCYTTRSKDFEAAIELIDGLIKTSIQVPADSIWFDGHFPEIAVLPGVAQLDMVVKVLSAALHRPVRIKGVSRVRFKQAVVPGDRVDIQIKPRENDAGNYGFRLLKRQELVCSGCIELEAESQDAHR